jgi:hypothetical protein
MNHAPAIHGVRRACLTAPAPSLRVVLLAVASAAALINSAVAAPVFSDVDAPAPALGFSPTGDRELRTRLVRFDPSVLRAAAARSADSAQVLELELFADAQFAVEVAAVESYGADQFVIRGALLEKGKPAGGIALLSVVNDVLQAEFRTPDGRKFVAADIGGGLNRLSEVDAQTAFECSQGDGASGATAIADGAPAPAPQPQGGETTEEHRGDGAVVDIMIVYTQAFARQYSGPSAIRAHCQNAVAMANTMFARSEIKSRMRLVHVAPVSYVEDVDMTVDVRRLLDVRDGFMDEVAALREQYAADVVHLFGYVEGQRRGFATGYPSDYHAVSISGELSLFTHELGHNFGCQHDRPSAGNGGLSWAFGHVFDGDDGRAYGCVMSYTGTAGAIQLPQFSNPNVSYRGVPTGVPKGRADSADNARAVDLNAPMIAGFRAPDGSSTRMPIFVTPPRASFPVTAVGSSSPLQSLRLAFAGASAFRVLRVEDFRVEGDADSFIVQVYNPQTAQYIQGPSFTVPTNGLQLHVRFRPCGRNEQKRRSGLLSMIRRIATRHRPFAWSAMTPRHC